MKTIPITAAVLLVLTGLGIWSGQARTTAREELRQLLAELGTPDIRCNTALWARPSCEAALSPAEKQVVSSALSRRGVSPIHREMTGVGGDLHAQYTCYVHTSEVCFYALISADRASTLVVATKPR